MPDHRQELAVLNNVFWYRAVFRAHGIDCGTDDLAWWSEAATPPFHSNLVVLSPSADASHVQGRLRAIARARSPSGLGVKDSFAKLDLSAAGYEILFEADWIWREHSHADSTGSAEAWACVTSAAELTAWESAWWGDARNKLDGPASCQFPASLLESPNHRFFFKLRGQAVVAGAIANRSPGVVGLSNAFSVSSANFDDWEGLIQCAGEHFPGVPLVGYERGAALACATSAGFVPVGALRVWNRVLR